MEVREAIERRRSIRGFKKDDLTDEIVRDILDCGRLAPSAKNRQPWYFVVVKNSLKNKIADLMIKYTEENDETEERKILKCPSSVKASALIMKQSPVLVLVFKSDDQNWVTGDTLSLGASIENMLLRATELDIGSLWIRDIIYVNREVEDLIGLDDYQLNCAISLGYASQSPKARPRKNLDEIVRFI